MPERFKDYIVVETYYKGHHHNYILNLNDNKDIEFGSRLRKKKIIKRIRTLLKEEIASLIEWEQFKMEN